MILQQMAFAFVESNTTKAEKLVYNVLGTATDARVQFNVIIKMATEIPMGAALLLCSTMDTCA